MRNARGETNEEEGGIMDVLSIMMTMNNDSKHEITISSNRARSVDAHDHLSGGDINHITLPLPAHHVVH